MHEGNLLGEECSHVVLPTLRIHDIGTYLSYVSDILRHPSSSHPQKHRRSLSSTIHSEQTAYPEASWAPAMLILSSWCLLFNQLRCFFKTTELFDDALALQKIFLMFKKQQKIITETIFITSEWKS